MTASLQVSQLLLLPLSSNSKRPTIPERRTQPFSSLCPHPHHLAKFPRVHIFSGVWRARSKEIVRAVAGASATMGAKTLSGRFAELKESGEVGSNHLNDPERTAAPHCRTKSILASFLNISFHGCEVMCAHLRNILIPISTQHYALYTMV